MSVSFKLLCCLFVKNKMIGETWAAVLLWWPISCGVENKAVFTFWILCFCIFHGIVTMLAKEHYSFFNEVLRRMKLETDKVDTSAQKCLQASMHRLTITPKNLSTLKTQSPCLHALEVKKVKQNTITKSYNIFLMRFSLWLLVLIKILNLTYFS